MKDVTLSCFATTPTSSPTTTTSSSSFFNGCKFSPDSTCLLTSESSTSSLHLYEPKKTSTPLAPVFTSKEGSTVYDYDWYPLMSSADPPSCSFLSSSQGSPLHLWDAFTGALRSSYVAYDHNDEPTSATCCRFSPDGEHIYAGYLNAVRVFRTGLPGRVCDLRRTVKARKVKSGQKGLISALACNPALSTYAAGSYGGSIYVYDERDGTLVQESCTEQVVEGSKVNSASAGKRKPEDEDEDIMAVAAAAKAQLHARGAKKGVTQLEWSVDGRRLFSSSRHSDAVLCWDVRMSSRPVVSYGRDGSSNQTLQFCLDPTESLLFVGSREAKLRAYDAQSGAEQGAVGEEQGIRDACNGVSVTFDSDGVSGHFAVATGQRHFGVARYDGSDNDDSDSDSESDEDKDMGGDLKVFSFKY